MKERLTIGVITAECDRRNTSDTMCGIIAQAFCANCNIIFLSALNNFLPPLHSQKKHEADIFTVAQSRFFDGFIYDRNTIMNREIAKGTDTLLRSLDRPVIILDGEESKFFENMPAHDYEEFQHIAEHLINTHGFTRIYCLTGPKGMPQSEDRLNAYLDTMKKYRLPVRDSWYEYGDFWTAAPAAFAGRIVSGEAERPQAVMCASDIMANALIQELRRNGLRVPQDIAVTGFDGYYPECEKIIKLTTYRKSDRRLGAEAFRRLYRLITGRNCKRVSIGEKGLVIGKSCGCQEDSAKTQAQLRQQRKKEKFEERMLHSDMLYDIIKTETPEELCQSLIPHLSNIDGLHRFRVFLSEDYNMALEGEDSSLDLAFAQLRETWSWNITEPPPVPDRPFPVRRLPELLVKGSAFPAAYYLTQLHTDGEFFGIATVSFGKKPYSYGRMYLIFINYLNAALAQILKVSQSAAQRKRKEYSVTDRKLYSDLNSLREDMRLHPELERNIGELCQSVHISRSYFQKMYKVYFGRSVFEELIIFRIEKAKRLLVQTELSVSDIAEQCGYSTYNHFVRQFRTLENKTPSEYRKEHI